MFTYTMINDNKFELSDGISYKTLMNGTEEMAINMVATKNSAIFEENKQVKIKELQDKYQSEYNAYLAKYPKREVESFDDKKREALAYNADNSASTPLVDAMVGGDADLRIEMLNSILEKIFYVAAQEGMMVATRDAIKACKTVDELNDIKL